MDEGLELKDWEMIISMARGDSVQASEHERDWGTVCKPQSMNGTGGGKVQSQRGCAGELGFLFL